ncbi:Malate/lactate/ureidoglycolate dehydrogenase, LDH2 family [Devosia psychrophila]|uniref:Malate/lactate/ureidoglycolate dehydrogenase, LDH2 family n=1 Tax=Devosia psychrophila TaxID=728005 RepID=A0A1I1HLB9_9HYPH|nr:Ldh family oxidoreductase [Devosia psychrophila]SFC22758.1 Malate/lactate/ureidoglycolate dehydrogenase, LDH2 family [Devosia psychrophila]
MAIDSATTIKVPEAVLAERVAAALREAGASEASLAAATRAMLHASRHGVDSHGVRLTEHYCLMLAGGRLNKNPQLQIDHKAAASAVVDGDDGLGHYAAYRAMEVACEMAKTSGIAAVGVRRSSHLGAAGAYALAGAEAGCIGFATTNTDSMVALFDGAQRFHGTNPLAFAAPVPGQKPWFVDMATSSIPMNRVLLHRSLGTQLPEGIAANAEGIPVTDPAEVNMLLPLGGADYGYKGAALAGVATLLSAILMGTTLDTDFIPMYDAEDTSTPRNMGHFFMAIDPGHFVGTSAFGDGMLRYLKGLRGAPARPGGQTMAPGDREWTIAEQRVVAGIPIDPDTARFLGLAEF